MENTQRLPRHVGIIMDGNGRWAEKKGKSRSEGHKAGLNTMLSLVEHAFQRGVNVVTVYALSTENLHRPKAEIEFLFSLFRQYFTDNVKKLLEKGISFRMLGDISLLPNDLHDLIRRAEADSKSGNPYVFNVAIGYGSRSEILRAVNLAVKAGKELSEEEFSSLLYTSGECDPDFIIRTGGEKRLSNFLLWQSAYAELYFSDVLFPDFDNEELDKAIAEYALRHRRFGKTQTQVETVQSVRRT